MPISGKPELHLIVYTASGGISIKKKRLRLQWMKSKQTGIWFCAEKSAQINQGGI